MKRKTEKMQMNNPIKVITTAVLLLFATLWQAPAQRLSDRYFGISEQDFVDTIKIKMWDGAIIVPVEIEGGNQGGGVVIAN